MRFPLAIAVVALLAGPAFANSQMSEDFVKKASMTDLFEVQSSQLALQKAQSADVKSFAQHMIDEHTKSTQKLKGIVGTTKTSASDKASGSDVAMTLDSEHSAMLNKLQNASGKDFDKLFVNMQLDGHKKALDLVKDYAQNGDDTKLKNFAKDMQPYIQEHLDRVQALNTKT